MSDAASELSKMALAMALAAIQADGKSMRDLNFEEKMVCIDSAVSDLKFVVDSERQRRYLAILNAGNGDAE
jgi:hypothetical protein